MKNLTKKSILKLKQSSTLVINEKCKELIKQGKKVYQFGFGQSPFPVPEKIVTALKDNAHRKEYLPIQGLKKLRENLNTADIKFAENRLTLTMTIINVKYSDFDNASKIITDAGFEILN